jgi:hypothetical protein
MFAVMDGFNAATLIISLIAAFLIGRMLRASDHPDAESRSRLKESPPTANWRGGDRIDADPIYISPHGIRLRGDQTGEFRAGLLPTTTA